MKQNEFRIIGRYHHKFIPTTDYGIGLFAVYDFDKNKWEYLEVEFKEDLVSILNSFNEKQLVGITGHIESFGCLVADNIFAKYDK